MRTKHATGTLKVQWQGSWNDSTPGDVVKYARGLQILLWRSYGHTQCWFGWTSTWFWG